MPEGEIWSRYWHFDRIASCFDGAGQTNYAEDIAGGWRAFFDLVGVTEPAELRMNLQSSGRVLSETWIYHYQNP